MPLITVIIACRNVEHYIAATLRSVLAQTIHDIEVVVIDDRSEDATPAICQGFVENDSRVRLLNGAGKGPAFARNIGIEAALGEWLLVVDGDDLIHPMRLEILLRAAHERRADIVADGLLAFSQSAGDVFAWPFLGEEAPQHNELLTFDRFLRKPKNPLSESPLGYLKPLLSRQFMNKYGLKYDEALIIGEDIDLILRCLFNGAVMHYHALPLYLYRRHNASLSHRLSIESLDLMLEANERLNRSMSGASSEEAIQLVRDRGERIKRQKTAVSIIAALQRWRVSEALTLSRGHGAGALLAVLYLLQGRWRRIEGIIKKGGAFFSQLQQKPVVGSDIHADHRGACLNFNEYIISNNAVLSDINNACRAFSERCNFPLNGDDFKIDSISMGYISSRELLK